MRVTLLLLICLSLFSQLTYPSVAGTCDRFYLTPGLVILCLTTAS